jgi:tRNA (cytidine/uridine-2'-O-)-methyltransferase
MDVVLVSPEIPQNTGSIARTCAATCTPLHLIHPMKFTIDEKRVRRAGLDYWPHVRLTEHPSWDSFSALGRGQWCTRRMIFIEEYGSIPYFSFQFHQEDFLIFGSETRGVTPAFIEKAVHERGEMGPRLCQTVAIPMGHPQVRSLNLSNAVSIVLFEARRQLGMDLPFTPRQPQAYEQLNE